MMKEENTKSSTEGKSKSMKSNVHIIKIELDNEEEDQKKAKHVSY